MSLTQDRAFQETLDLLEWPQLCAHLSVFASTGMGRSAARRQTLPDNPEGSRLLLAETVEMAVLDDLTEGGLSFRGVVDLGP
ncbi:MAG: endonuclease MutS2, partial [Synechococcus sp. CPC35]|nr:endonuclease MutS2 [Synechococcus sp. CPC35]